jgi:PIN domain nuclease of toxin-antitoxin system
MLATGDLPVQARREINEAANFGAVKIAAISLWETAMLASRDRVRLGKPIAQWIEDALAAPGISVEPLSPDIAIESCGLPGRLHADPSDRMIVATARVTDARLMTRDRQIRAYAAGGHVTVVAA